MTNGNQPTPANMKDYEFARLAQIAADSKDEDFYSVTADAMDSFYEQFDMGGRKLNADPIIAGVISEAQMNIARFGNVSSAHFSNAVTVNAKPYIGAYGTSKVSNVLARATSNGFSIPAAFRTYVDAYKNDSVVEVMRKAKGGDAKAKTVLMALESIEATKFKGAMLPKLLKQRETRTLEAIAGQSAGP